MPPLAALTLAFSSPSKRRPLLAILPPCPHSGQITRSSPLHPSHHRPHYHFLLPTASLPSVVSSHLAQATTMHTITRPHTYTHTHLEAAFVTHHRPGSIIFPSILLLSILCILCINPFIFACVFHLFFSIFPAFSLPFFICLFSLATFQNAVLRFS